MEWKNWHSGDEDRLLFAHFLGECFPAAEHLPVSVKELLPGLLAYGIGQFGRLVTAAEVHGFAKALGKFDARRATSKMSFNLLAGVRGKL
jgi:hypothetical protein